MFRTLACAFVALSTTLVCGAVAETAQDFKISSTEMSGVISLKLSNTSTVPRFYRFRVKSSANVDVGPITAIDKVCPPGATVPLIVVSKIDPTQPTKLEYECTSEAAGNAPPELPRLVRSAMPDRKYLYQVPSAPGTKTTVYAGYNSPDTHAGLHALDFDIPFGAPVHAMRGGRVSHVINDKIDNPSDLGPFFKGGPANIVIVDHGDGTSGLYAHLKQSSVVVKVGQIVREGEHLAACGNSGANGAHLHVAIYEGNGGRTIPALYKTAEHPEGVELKVPMKVSPAPPDGIEVASQGAYQPKR